MTMIERVARAIEAAQCEGREGPFGGYDYGYPDDKPVEGGRYVVRDFRDPGSDGWGAWVHQSDDRDKHERVFKQMTDHHVAKAAIEAMRDPTDEMVSASHAALGYDGDYSITRYQAMINKALEGE